MEKQIKAIVLLSGGLDSMLAVKVLQEQGVKILGLTFVSHFFDAQKAKEAAKQLDIRLKIIDFSHRQLEVVKNPKYGHGRNMNPCIDCHALMFKLAKKEMTQGGFDFIATGEVLGERPMSQNKNSLATVEKEAGLAGYLLRPLSAKLLAPTIVEKDGRVDREKLLALSGRQRRSQIELAKKYGIKKYPSPAGGCLLTDPEFSLCLKVLIEKKSRAGAADMKLLKLGRHIWDDEILYIVGRDHKENLILKKLAQKNDILAEAVEVPGPIILVRNYGDGKLIKNELAGKIKEFLVKYNQKAQKLKQINIKWQMV